MLLRNVLRGIACFIIFFLDFTQIQIKLEFENKSTKMSTEMAELEPRILNSA